MSKPEENRRPQTLRSRLPIWASTSLQPRRQPSLIPPPTQQPMGAAPSHPLLSLDKPSSSLSKPAPPSEPLKNLDTKTEESKNAETRDTKDRKLEKNDLPREKEDQKAEIFGGNEEEEKKKKNEDDGGDQKEEKKELFKENVEKKREGEASATEKKKNKEDEEGDKKEIDAKDNDQKKKEKEALFSENMAEERGGEASATRGLSKRSLREKEVGHVTRELPKEAGHVTRELPKEIREGVSKLLHGFKLEERSNGGQGTTVITLAGDNRGACMTVNGKEEEDGKKRGWVLNSNVQGVNNSILKGSCCRVELPSWENEGLKLGWAPMEGKEKKGGRRCLRALLMDSSDEDGENPRRRHGYRCVCDEGKKGSA